MIQILGVCSAALGGKEIPSQLAYMVSLVVKGIQVVIPVMLIIWGMLDLGKAVIAQKEDEIKKGQQIFVKRIITAAIVFFVVVIVKLFVGLVADDGNITGCIDSIMKCDTKNCTDTVDVGD